MAIVTRLGRELENIGWNSKRLIAETGLSAVTISKLKRGHARAIKMATLDSICKAMGKQPGDILEYMDTDEAIRQGLIIVDGESEDSC